MARNEGRGLWLVSSGKARPSVYLPTKDWILTISRWWISMWIFAQLDLRWHIHHEAWLENLETCERKDESLSTQLSLFWFWLNCCRMNTVFKLPCFEVICQVAVDNEYRSYILMYLPLMKKILLKVKYKLCMLWV